MQNTSHAVMAQRAEARDSLDDFPTPPWATRALLEHIIERDTKGRGLSVLEPACGRGHMAQALSEYFDTVHASDIHDYGYRFGHQADFLSSVYSTDRFDWIITNPPFRLAEDFIHRALPLAKRGVAVLVRTVFIESVGRFDRIFRERPPTKFAQFTERVPMVKGRVDKKASTATGYAWVVWEHGGVSPQLCWVPPCRKSLEKPDDYGPTFLGRSHSDVEMEGPTDLFGMRKAVTR